VERKGECDSALENSTEEPKWRATWASRKRDSEGRRVAASSSPPLQVLALRDPELGRGYGFSTLPPLVSSPLPPPPPTPGRGVSGGGGDGTAPLPLSSSGFLCVRFRLFLRNRSVLTSRQSICFSYFPATRIGFWERFLRLRR
jgi:hypothetical protein